ncbi:WD40 repeat-like protein [Marasmius fiardii PR-910]|nr:WD40 repeat-like protein [Marasmius fiardii PR-910]
MDQQQFHHDLPANLKPSLSTNNRRDKVGFPRTTTNILTGHRDEVWNIEWSHDGKFLASASRDKTAIIWRVKEDGQWEDHKTLRQHPYPVTCLAWSMDDSVLLTSSENYIKLWDTKVGLCVNARDEHTETVTALSWLPDGSGFLSASLDRRIIQWDHTGSNCSHWEVTSIRVTGLAIAPDMARVIAIGMASRWAEYSDPSCTSGCAVNDTPPNQAGGRVPIARIIRTQDRMVIYEYPSREIETSILFGFVWLLHSTIVCWFWSLTYSISLHRSIRLEGQCTSITVSRQYALINYALDEILLWDLHEQRITRKFVGLKQGQHIIRSCIGGTGEKFVVSGSEDGNVYVWLRDTGILLEVLDGHGEGSVNSVAWNPTNPGMFASCSDDWTVRIWETPEYGIVTDT